MNRKRWGALAPMADLHTGRPGRSMTPQVRVVAQPAATTRPPAGSRLPMRSQPAQGCQEAPRVSRMSRVPSLAPAQRPQPLSPRPLLRQLTDAGACAEPLRRLARTGLERRLHLARSAALRDARCRRPALSLCLRDPRVVDQPQQIGRRRFTAPLAPPPTFPTRPDPFECCLHEVLRSVLVASEHLRGAKEGALAGRDVVAKPLRLREHLTPVCGSPYLHRSAPAKGCLPEFRT
jgi:hypothetical protein